jgi:hypothetical protein
MTILLITFALFVGSLNAQAACPTGSYPWMDNWGNQICKTFNTGETRSIQGSTSRCPAGSYPWVDNWGNQICQSFQDRQPYYDTSKGCPIGTYQWVDNWGNQVCRRF